MEVAEVVPAAVEEEGEDAEGEGEGEGVVSSPVALWRARRVFLE